MNQQIYFVADHSTLKIHWFYRWSDRDRFVAEFPGLRTAIEHNELDHYFDKDYIMMD